MVIHLLFKVPWIQSWFAFLFFFVWNKTEQYVFLTVTSSSGGFFFSLHFTLFLFCNLWLFLIEVGYLHQKKRRRITHYFTWNRHFVANSEQSRIVLSGGTSLFSGAALSVSIDCSYFIKMWSQCEWIQKELWLLFHGQEHKNLSTILGIRYSSSLPSFLKNCPRLCPVNYCDTLQFNWKAFCILSLLPLNR